ncbi:MAG: hypothetical protein KDE45_13590, partial [Caldilineaceae bacterium]|nr:hypothetical protein [Caldilineaceae bacterium]
MTYSETAAFSAGSARAPVRRPATTVVEPEPHVDVVRSHFAMRLFGIIGAIMVLTLLIHLGGRAIGHSLSTGGHSASRKVHSIVIGANMLSVPENMIRFANQRRSGIHNRIDLYALYPKMTGYTSDTRAWFNDQAPDRRLVFMSIDERQMSRDMSGRFGPIYSIITQPTGEATPSGLTRYAFKPSSGYSNEELLVGPEESGQPRFVVRCLTGNDSAMALSACERDI